MTAAAHRNDLLQGPTIDADLGNGFLTARETEILALDAEGFTDKEIARMLGIAPRTVINHNESAKEKLFATNRTHLVTRAFVMGILQVRSLVITALLIFATLVLDDDLVRPVRPRRQNTTIRLVRGNGGRRDA